MMNRSFLTVTCGCLAAMSGLCFGIDGKSQPAAVAKADVVAADGDLAKRWRAERDAHLQFFPDAPHDASSMLIQWSKDADALDRHPPDLRTRARP